MGWSSQGFNGKEDGIWRTDWGNSDSWIKGLSVDKLVLAGENIGKRLIKKLKPGQDFYLIYWYDEDHNPVWNGKATNMTESEVMGCLKICEKGWYWSSKYGYPYRFRISDIEIVNNGDDIILQTTEKD